MKFYEVCTNWQCRIQPMSSIEPGMDYLRQEIERLNQEIESLKQEMSKKKMTLQQKV
jgi:hypothetical protein